MLTHTTFNVGDRILMGGVRGDVIGLSFMQTRIMEMGQSTREETDQKSWVRSRSLPIHYPSDYGQAERCILDAATKHAITSDRLGDERVTHLEERFGIAVGDINPRVFWRVSLQEALPG